MLAEGQSGAPQRAGWQRAEQQAGRRRCAEDGAVTKKTAPWTKPPPKAPSAAIAAPAVEAAPAEVTVPTAEEAELAEVKDMIDKHMMFEASLKKEDQNKGWVVRALAAEKTTLAALRRRRDGLGPTKHQFNKAKQRVKTVQKVLESTTAQEELAKKAWGEAASLYEAAFMEKAEAEEELAAAVAEESSLEDLLAAENGRQKADPILAFTASCQMALASMAVAPEVQQLMAVISQAIHASSVTMPASVAEAAMTVDEPPATAVPTAPPVVQATINPQQPIVQQLPQQTYVPPEIAAEQQRLLEQAQQVKSPQPGQQKPAPVQQHSTPPLTVPVQQQPLAMQPSPEIALSTTNQAEQARLLEQQQPQLPAMQVHTTAMPQISQAAKEQEAAMRRKAAAATAVATE